MTCGVPYRTPRRRPATKTPHQPEEDTVSATITIATRHGGSVTVTDEAMIRAVVEAVVAFNRGEGDRQFRIRRPSPSQHIRKSTIFKASEVTAVNANGVDLLDAPNPTSTVGQVAA